MIIGIDPGKTGGTAHIENGELVGVVPFKGDIMVCREVGRHAHLRNAHFFIEKVTASPQMGVVSAFTFGRWAEAVECTALLSGLPVHMVRPQVWQSAIGVFSDGDKKALYAHAMRLYPAQHKLKMFNATTCDAVLIAHYGWRYMENQ